MDDDNRILLDLCRHAGKKAMDAVRPTIALVDDDNTKMGVVLMACATHILVPLFASIREDKWDDGLAALRKDIAREVASLRKDPAVQAILSGKGTPQ